jgi:signal transduction histidine kinase
MPSFEDLYQCGPIVPMIRNPKEPWQIVSISDNISKFGLVLDSLPFDLSSYISESDLDIITRKLGAAIMQKRDSITLRYRIHGNIQQFWVEDFCSLTYNEDGDVASAGSLLWITNLPLEWHLQNQGMISWNTLNSKLRHDMLNQLTAILGYLELSADMIEDPMLKDFGNKEQNAAEKIREKLIFTRDYQKIGQTECDWVKLSVLLTEVVTEAGCQHLKVNFNLPDVKIFADKVFKQALVRIFENIPEHASDATNIEVRFTKTNQGGTLSIQDNGPGIPEDQKTRIFDLGYGKGAGFGLFLSEKLLSIYDVSLQETGIFGTCAKFELHIPGEIMRMPN